MENQVKISGAFYIAGDKITFQEAGYIEYGWYVEKTKEEINLYEIPYGGGKPYLIGSYDDIISAIKAGYELT